MSSDANLMPDSLDDTHVNLDNSGDQEGNSGASGDNRGVCQVDRGRNLGNRVVNQGNVCVSDGTRGGTYGNRGFHRGNRSGNRGVRSENRGVRSANRGKRSGNRGIRSGNRGSRDSHNQGVCTGMPQMAFKYNMRLTRGQSEDRHSHSSVGNVSVRRDHGGRYGSTSSLVDQRQGSPQRGEYISKQGCYIGFRILEELSRMEPDRLVVALTNKITGLDKLLQTDLSNDFIVLILRVLTQMCKSAFKENRATIFATVCQKFFLDQLTIYLSDICTHDGKDKLQNNYFWEEQERFWNDLLNFYENVMKIIPNTGFEQLPRIVKKTFIYIHDIEKEHDITVPSEIKDRLANLQEKITMIVEEREKKNENNSNIAQVDVEPPDDFRLISLYPTVFEITNQEKAFIRPNIIEGRYCSVDHYLDIQFRLLREDFVAPLRNGICDFLQQITSHERKRIFNVRIYKNVFFGKKYTIQDKIAFEVHLSLKKKIKFENSRRFMFGSLVCFTNNNFQSIIFGTVVDRDKKLLENNKLAVDIMNNTVTSDPYIMVECSVYFEPYYHVLKALQMMTEESFPLKRYIIDVVPDVNHPSYYTYSTEINHEIYKFIPLIPNSWPSYQQLGLDESQYRAFNAALTKEFCVIQGPPGTGKTFIGLKITQVLLENMEVWNTTECPILVICFTNHALDQFLEGILKYTQQLVRIGGQSKSEKLKGRNIRDLRTRALRMRDCGQLMITKRREIRECMSEIHNHQALLDIMIQCDRVFNFEIFVAIDHRIRNSWFSSAETFEFIDWLLGGRNRDERYEERERNRIAQIQTQVHQEKQGEAESDSDHEFFETRDQEERRVDDGEEFRIETEHIDMDRLTLVTINMFDIRIQVLESELLALGMKTSENNYYVYDEIRIKEEELFKLRYDFAYFQWRMDQLRANNLPPRPLNVDYNRPDILTADERWGLYFYWLRQFRKHLEEDLTVLFTNYRRIYRQYEEVRQIEDTQIMKKMLVIGMTTSGAARYQTLLQALKCPIVIVEEAAEVLESHVVVSLTNDCKHLILIGDHQQLRPTTAEYRLAKRYNLEISLFERMVKNKIHCEQLEVQHRMRPEIARLIVPTIYPKLTNHHSVENYPPICGVTKNLFFITHTEKEESESDTESKRNIHEARFLIRLARHFVLQGYNPHEITILATYSGQMFCLWKEKRNFPHIADVRITVVDNFQGEENRIILLSLVRSNEEENVGFLKTDNRVCVALSRAKEGMYIIGNMNILEKSSELWRQIKDVLEQNDQLGTHLTLQCQVHLDQLTRVATAEDFCKVPEGGCTQLCNKQLNCGHICTSTCHIIDREHEDYKCKEKCSKILCELNHQCPDLCFEKCKPCFVPVTETLQCGHTHPVPCHMYKTSEYNCPTLVDVELGCGHRTKKPCYQDVNQCKCPHPCDIRMLCGHACTRYCHVNDDPDHLKMICKKECERIKKGCSLQDESHKCKLKCYEDCQTCEEEVEKRRTCGHVFLKIACNANVEDIECPRRCIRRLPCGHNCRRSCIESCDNCLENVTKIVPECNHPVKVKCFEMPTRKKCNKQCPLPLTCGHPCNKRCNELCQSKCEVLVDHSYQPACGHQFQIPCYKTGQALEPNSFELLQHCTEPCGTILLCEHRCSGTCGTCAQGRVHATCSEKCGRILVCGHSCDIPCSEMCKPCNKICSYRCVHSRCGLKCGEPCNPCVEKCSRRCKHINCSRRCGQPCNVKPCTEPCRKLRKCKHPCIGYCGDPCPPICRVCDPENESFSFFGTEEYDDRYVYLRECGHTIEATAMERWLNQSVEDDVKEINLKRCPKCSTILTSTQRYSGFIKEVFSDINKIKIKWFGQENRNEESRVQLQSRITAVKNISEKLYSQSDSFKRVLYNLESLLRKRPKGKRNPLNVISIMSCQSEIELIENLVDIFNKGKLEENEVQFKACLKPLEFILNLLNKKHGLISKQAAADVELEINKFERIVQLSTIEINKNFIAANSKSEIEEIYRQIKDVLYSYERYSKENDKVLKSKLDSLAEAVDKTITITDEEKKSIVKAMQEGRNGLGRGRWFKCPQGHYFTIGDCGGAMQIGKCIECGSAIGGQNHALLPSNSFAGEMDGATRPAWSNAANLDMRNYRF